MANSHNKLSKMMIDENMINAELMKKSGFSASIITRLKKEKYVSIESIEKIFNSLHCRVDDILKFIGKSDWLYYRYQYSIGVEGV